MAFTAAKEARMKAAEKELDSVLANYRKQVSELVKIMRGSMKPRPSFDKAMREFLKPSAPYFSQGMRVKISAKGWKSTAFSTKEYGRRLGTVVSESPRSVRFSPGSYLAPGVGNRVVTVVWDGTKQRMSVNCDYLRPASSAGRRA